MDFIEFIRKWEEYLNNDGEIRRRISKDIKVRGDLTEKTFSGIPGGHYERARSLEKKYKVWPRSMGLLHYPHGGKSMLDAGDIIEITIPERFTYTISLKDGVFRIKEGKAAQRPCLGVEMPLDLFKDMLLTGHRVIYTLADPRNKVTCISGLPHGDWITIFEILVAAQEVVDMDPKMCELAESL